MKFSEIASRLTGLNIWVFGAQWTPPTSDVAVARKVITELETRRVLFASYTNEVPGECVASVDDIRKIMTRVLVEGGIDDRLADRVRLIRRYCMQFLDRVGAVEDRRDTRAAGRHLFREEHYRMNDYFFGEALGEFRSGVVLQVAIIAVAYGLDVEDDLARVLPPPEENLRPESW